MLKMGSVLVTGGAGFIGSHLVEKLVENGYNVVVIDNLLRGNLSNLSNVMSKIKFVKGDIRGYELMRELVKNSEMVFHLASLSRVVPSVKNPELCFKINVGGTEIIARLCSKYSKKLIFSSSREVYGTARYIPVDEAHPLSPENPYGASKVAGEKIIEAYAKSYGLSYATLRLANVYGPRDFDRVIPIFIKNALEGKNLIIYGANKILDFVYIDDVINAFISAMDINENQTLNIGSGKGTNIVELAKLVKKVTGKNGKIVVKEKRKGEVDKFIASIEKAEEVLKWRPKVTLEEGISRIIKLAKLSF
jgi:UDP-glucose 4-epimerase